MYMGYVNIHKYIVFEHRMNVDSIYEFRSRLGKEYRDLEGNDA